MAQKTFKGYAITDHQKWTDFKVIEYPAKNWEETDVEVEITHCGVCASDMHTISAGAKETLWGKPELPICPGHEIAGIIKRVGSKVTDKNLKVGARVGVGAQCGCCYKCKDCLNNNENYCPHTIDTYGSKYPDGVRTQGGYSTGIIVNELFAFAIPDAISNEDVASMLCAGLTVYAPMRRRGVGPGKKVGIIGIGGLGHYALLFAKAMGAYVIAYSHSDSKKADALKMGADEFITTHNAGFEKSHFRDLDVLVSTTNASDGFPLTEFFSTINTEGHFVLVGLPDGHLPPINTFALTDNSVNLCASHVGSKSDCLAMLALAAEKKIKPWIELMPMKDCGKAIERIVEHKTRYRTVLVQDLL